MEHGAAISTQNEQEAVQYVTEVTGFFLALRGTGVCLSPNDMSLVQRWQEAGLPLTTVLRGLHRGSTQKAGRPAQARVASPLTLRSLNKAVEKEALSCAPKRERAGRRRKTVQATLGASDSPATAVASSAPAVSESALKAYLAEVRGQLEQLIDRSAALPDIQDVFIETVQALEPTAAQATQPLLALLQLGRTLYERLWRALPEVDRRELDAELELLLQEPLAEGDALSELEPAASADAPLDRLASQSEAEQRGPRLSTLSIERQWELRLRALRERFHLFEPEALMRVWEDHDSDA